MASVNKVILVGNLGRDPDVRYLPGGDAVANVSVATSYKPSSGAKELTEWHRVAFFDRLAEIAGEYLKKGAQVYIEGRLQTHKYTGKDGIERYSTEVIANNMQILSARDKDAAADEAPAAPHTPPPQAAPRPAPSFPDMDDDIPF